MSRVLRHRITVTPVALSLACGLLIAGHPVAPAAIGFTIAVILLVTAAQNPILYISSLGSLGMAIGAIIEHHPILSCCLSPFAIDTLISWPTLLMCVFCIAGSRGHMRVYCSWTTLPTMYLGMCLTGHYLSTPLQPVFGPFLAVNWTMFFGMAAGHGVGYLAIPGRHKKVFSLLTTAPKPSKLPEINKQT